MVDIIDAPALEDRRDDLLVWYSCCFSEYFVSTGIM